MSQSTYKSKRREEAIKEAKQRKIRNLMLATVAVIAVIIVFALVFHNKSQTAKNEQLPTSADPFLLEQQPMLGKADAPITIVEFGDFKCPICMRFAGEVLPNLQKDYIDTGLAKLYFINYPFIGTDSTTAAMAVESAYAQNKAAAWPYIEAIYRNQQDEHKIWATDQTLVDIAKQANVGLDTDKLAKDLKAGTYKGAVNSDLAIVHQQNLDGTPTVYINGKQIDLPTLFTYDKLKAVLDAAKGAK